MSRKDTENTAIARVGGGTKPGKASQPRQAGGERRYIYNGDPQERIPGYAVRPANRKPGIPRKRSTFNIVAFLFLAAVVGVAYVGNILAVNQLNMEVNRLQQQYDKIDNANRVLKAEINRKSAWERIGNTATQQLGMVYPKERPEALDIDESKLKTVQEK